MIQKIEIGRGARGTLEYVLASVDAEGVPRPVVEIVGGTMAGRNAREMAREFGALRSARPNLGRAVCHTSLRLAPGDRPLSREEWAEAGKRWAEGMGFDAYVVVSHGDHAHVVACRVRADGTVVSDSNDYRRGEQIVRGIERDLNLVRVAPSHLLDRDRAATHRKALTRGEVAQAERGALPPAELVRQAIERRLSAGPCTAVEFRDALEAEGITVRPNLASTGRLNGFAYEIDGQAMTAKQLGGAYTLKHLQGRGLSYEQGRDHQGLRDRGPGPEGDGPRHRGDGLGADQAAPGGAAGADRAGVGHGGGGVRGPAGTPGAEPGGAEHGDGRGPRPGAEGDGGRPSPGDAAGGAAGAGAVERDRGDRRPPGRGDDRPDGAGRGDQGPRDRLADGGPRADPDAPGPAARVGAGDGRRPPDDAPPPRRGDPRGRAGDREPVAGGAVERILDLAAPALAADAGSAVGAGGGGGVAGAAPRSAGAAATGALPADRTARAVDQYLGALDAHSYTVAVRRADGTTIRREGLTPDQVREALPWLRRENALGADVYARPGGTGYVLLDDVPADRLAEAKREGFRPAVVLETSPGNLAAWVRVGPGLRPEEATALNRGMAKRYGADPASIDAGHLSRLPGLTNRKPNRARPDGQAPFVLVREAWGRVCDAAERAKAWARDTVLKLAERRREREAAEDAARRLEAIQGAPERRSGASAPPDTPLDAYRRHAGAALRADPAGCEDRSRLDYRAAQRMLQAGHGLADVAAGIEAGSPELAQRKGEAAADYAERTARKAADSEPVRRHLAEQARQRAAERQGRGYGL